MGRLCVKRCPGQNKLHVFPNRYTDRQRRKKWCQILGVKDMPHELYACSRHFSRSMLCLKHPRKDALPDLNLGTGNEAEERESFTLEIVEICDSSTQTDQSYFNQTPEQLNHSSNDEMIKMEERYADEHEKKHSSNDEMIKMEELYADEHEIETTISIPVIHEIKADPLKDDNFKPRKINIRKPTIRKK